MLTSQEAVNELSRILNLYEIKHHRIFADPLIVRPSKLVITTMDKDGVMLSISKINDLAPTTNEEKYAQILLEEGMLLISRLSNIMTVRH